MHRAGLGSSCTCSLFGGGVGLVLEVARHRIVHGLQPGRVVNGGLVACHGGDVRDVPERHDVKPLVVLPFEELLISGCDVKMRVVGLSNERLDVIALVDDSAFVRGDGVLAGTPLVKVLLLHLGVRQLDLTHHHVTRVPGLGVEHVEGVPLVLHAEIHTLEVLLEEDAIVQLVTP